MVAVTDDKLNEVSGGGLGLTKFKDKVWMCSICGERVKNINVPPAYKCMKCGPKSTWIEVTDND